jgi:hypothetical protein
MPSMRNDTPIAVMRGASRGESRSLRYATSSMTTPTIPAPIIDSGKTMASASSRPPKLLAASESRWNTPEMKTAKKPAAVKTSPCAKLINSMMP